MKTERAYLREEMRAASEALLAKLIDQSFSVNQTDHARWVDEAYRRLGRIAIKLHFYEKGRRQARER